MVNACSDRLDQAEILSQCFDCFDGDFTLTVLDEVSSTNDYLLSHFSGRSAVCLAERQTAPRARKASRVWHVPAYQNISLSLVYSFKKPVFALSALSLVVALSVTRALIARGFADVKVKWPNDIVVADKKLAGILLDVVNSDNDASSVIMGIGLNVNMLDDDGQAITQPWTSLRLLTGEALNRNSVVVDLLRQLSQDFVIFEQQGFGAFMAFWDQVDCLKGQVLDAFLPGGQVEVGLAQGVTESGFLKLRCSQGQVKHYHNAQVSVRPSRLTKKRKG